MIVLLALHRIPFTPRSVKIIFKLRMKVKNRAANVHVEVQFCQNEKFYPLVDLNYYTVLT